MKLLRQTEVDMVVPLKVEIRLSSSCLVPFSHNVLPKYSLPTPHHICLNSLDLTQNCSPFSLLLVIHTWNHYETDCVLQGPSPFYWYTACRHSGSESCSCSGRRQCMQRQKLGSTEIQSMHRCPLSYSYNRRLGLKQCYCDFPVYPK